VRIPQLPVVDWTDGPADWNGLVRFAERRNLVSARVPSHFKRNKTKSGFCACAITFQTQQDEIWFLRICHHISNALYNRIGHRWH